MKPSPYFEEVVYFATHFLRSIGYEKYADKIEKDHEIPEWVL